MTSNEVKQQLNKHDKTWNEFQKFMNGQTIGLDCINCSDKPDEEVGNAKYTCPECGGIEWQSNYYKIDVARFLRINVSEL